MGGDAASRDDEEIVVFRMTLRDHALDAYRKLHDAIWPELGSAIAAAGVLDYRIYHQDDSDLLIAVMRRRRDHQLDDLAASSLMRRWWNMTKDMIVSDDDGVPVQRTLEEVFRL